MNGIIDFTGTKVGTLDIGTMIRRHPEPAYTTVCRQCGAQSTGTQSQVRYGSARCLAAGCGKSVANRHDRLTEERQAAAQRETERIADERRIAELRMQAEVGDDYELPSRYAPKPSEHRVMSERERQSLREHKATEDAARLEAERPAREAQEQAEREQRQRERAEQERTERQTAYWRDAVLNSPDARLFVSEGLVAASMKKSEADALNANSVQQFVAENPWYRDYKTPANSEALLAYLDLNRIQIFDAPTLKAAFVRLRDLGILSKKVTPETKPTTAPKHTVVSSQSTGPVKYKGRDYETGLEREFTAREVDRMSADDYKRAFHVASTVGELFASIADQRQ